MVDRQPPSSLVQKRQLMSDASNNGSDIPMMEDDVSKGVTDLEFLENENAL